MKTTGYWSCRNEIISAHLSTPHKYEPFTELFDVDQLDAIRDKYGVDLYRECYADANSSEFTPEGQHNVIDLMPDQQGVETKGGTMRLGKYPCVITPGTKMADCYGTTEIDERHRHRYEFNNEFRAEFEEKGLVIAGTSPDGRLVEAVEIPGRDFHLGAQFHPEFKSRPNRAHPLFKGFIAAALKFQSEHTPTGHPAVLGE